MYCAGGVVGQGEAVDLIARGEAHRVDQSTVGATYDKLWRDKKLTKVDARDEVVGMVFCGNLFLMNRLTGIDQHYRFIILLEEMIR